MVTEQVPVSSVQPNAPGPSAPDGSLGQLPLVVVCSLSTWSNEGAGGGFGGGAAKLAPWLVALSHSQAEIVKATVLAVFGGPHSACAQAFTLVPE